MNHKIQSLTLLLIVALLLPAIALADRKAEIETRAKLWESKYNAGDAAGVAAIYAEDAQILPPQTDAVSGPAAIQQYWQGVLNAGIKGTALQVVEVFGSGDTAAEVGLWVMKNAEGKEVDHGKYIVVWQKKKGTWMIVRDMWNSSVMPMPASAPK